VSVITHFSLAVKKEYGLCYGDMQTDLCQRLARIDTVPSPHTCSFSNCTGFACNKFPTVAGCPQNDSLNKG